MKKHYFFKFVLLLIPALAFLLMSNSGGNTTARSGSPGDGGVTCASCHSGGNFNASAEITTNIPVTGYLLNTDYTININTTSTSNTHGFQMVAENGSNTKIGTFVAGSGSRVSGDRIVQSTPSSSGDWSFTWRSPSTDQGEVTFYTAVNAANGNGGTSGDQVVTAQLSNVSLSVDNLTKIDFDTYPNPATDFVTLQLASNTDNAVVAFYDSVGKIALQTNITNTQNKVDVNDLASGIYLIKIISGNRIGTQKFIKQ